MYKKNNTEVRLMNRGGTRNNGNNHKLIKFKKQSEHYIKHKTWYKHRTLLRIGQCKGTCLHSQQVHFGTWEVKVKPRQFQWLQTTTRLEKICLAEKNNKSAPQWQRNFMNSMYVIFPN